MNKSICLDFKKLSQCKKTETRNSICLHFIKKSLNLTPFVLFVVFTIIFTSSCHVVLSSQLSIIYLNQTNQNIKIKNKFLLTDYANLLSRQLQNEEQQKLQCNIKINLHNNMSRAASRTVLQRAVKLKQVPTQRHYKVPWPAQQSLAPSTRRGCGSGKPPEIRDNDESNPENLLKRATWKGRNFIITLSNCFEVKEFIC